MISSTSYTDIVLTNGAYYYVITTVNNSGESLPSNCQSVTISIPYDIPNLNNTISGYMLFPLFFVISIIIIVKKNFKNHKYFFFIYGNLEREFF